MLSTLLEADTCALFPDFPPQESAVFASLYDSVEDALIQEMLEVVCASSLFVTEKLEQGKYGKQATEVEKQQTKHARKSNLIGENDFRDFDYSNKQKPDAHILHHSSVLMTKRNKTFKWVDSKTQEEKEQLFTLQKIRHREKAGVVVGEGRLEQYMPTPTLGT
ncbi:Hypp8420 [Branchiostoma lanceolatum]|uniref:Hypp8420 protein n=1 Tax=Branchiostoma lanceolatum TaxID=7740 RepID=A0A8K0EDE3_BRALA|nr:Hypp8420 [Branchiostoma lanceolatum]